MLPLQVQNTIQSSENMMQRLRTHGMTHFLQGVEDGKKDPLNAIRIPFKKDTLSYTYPEFLTDVKSFFQQQQTNTPPKNCKMKGGKSRRKVKKNKSNKGTQKKRKHEYVNE